jgi:AcrR family transcriptional regulator
MARSYESPVRKQRAAETHERILAAGSELVHELPGWDWRALTVRAVAERAGVNEKTVYRHFSSERDLHDAVMRRLEEEADIDLGTLALDDVGAATERLYSYLASFPANPRPHRDPTFADTDKRRRAALLDAVAGARPDWSEKDRAMAAAALDLLWILPSFERLVTAWDLDADDAAATAAWVIGLLDVAIREGPPPSASS